MVAEALEHTIDTWIQALAAYDFIQLCAKPSFTDWSMGQLYIHLIEDTNYYFEQIKTCLSNNDNIDKQPLPAARTIFFDNDLPNKKIEGAAANASIPQPESREQLMNGLMNLKDQIASIERLILAGECKGRTRHPGLGYFSAHEWFQFAEIHFRHHLRQKERIDHFLKTN